MARQHLLRHIRLPLRKSLIGGHRHVAASAAWRIFHIGSAGPEAKEMLYLRSNLSTMPPQRLQPGLPVAKKLLIHRQTGPSCDEKILLTAQTLLYHTHTITTF